MLPISNWRSLIGILVVGLGLMAGGGLAQAQGFSCSGSGCCIKGSTETGKQCVSSKQGSMPDEVWDKYAWIIVRQKNGGQLVGLANDDGSRTLVKPTCASAYFSTPHTLVCEEDFATIHLLDAGKSVKTGYRATGKLGDSGLVYGARAAKSKPSLADVGVFDGRGVLLSTITDVVRTEGAPMTRPRRGGSDLFVPIGETWMVQRSEGGRSVFSVMNVLTGKATVIGETVVYLASRTDPKFNLDRMRDYEERKADEDPTRTQLAGAATGRFVNPGAGLENSQVVRPLAMDGQLAAMPPGVLGVLDVDGLEFGFGFAVVSETGGKLRYGVGTGDALSVLARAENLPTYDGLARVQAQRSSCRDFPWDALCNQHVVAKTAAGWVVLQTTNPEFPVAGEPAETPQQAVAAMIEGVLERGRVAAAAEAAAKEAELASRRAQAQAALASAAPCYGGVVAALDQGRWNNLPETARKWAVMAELRYERSWASAIGLEPQGCPLQAASAASPWGKSVIARAPLQDVVPAIEAETDFQFRLIGFEIIAKRPETAAQTAYGRFLWRDQNPNDALKVWAGAAAAGDLDAQAELAWKLYQPFTNKVRQDPETAYLIAKDGAARGSVLLQRLVDQIEADRVRKQQLDAYNAATVRAQDRIDFILRCGYIEPSEQHNWICAR